MANNTKKSVTLPEFLAFQICIVLFLAIIYSKIFSSLKHRFE
ncbi:MAG: hypothetical protein RI894_2134 [Bacteroidota bacterium]|jgi:hypothetical protein